MRVSPFNDSGYSWPMLIICTHRRDVKENRCLPSPFFSKAAKPGILFSTFCEGVERIIRDEGRAGFAPLNDLHLCERKLNRGKDTIKEGKL